VEALNGLVEYGILGMWTLSLLLSNHTMRKNFQGRYDDLNKNVVETLKKNYEMLQRNREDHKEIMEKLDEGLEAMKQKYLEEKLRAQYEQKENFKNTRG
jgi:cell division protein FtsB